MKRPRILFISNLFPNVLEPHRAAFSRQQIAALSEFAIVDIVSPISWTTKGRQQVPAACKFQGCEVFHPTYWYVPGMFRSLYGLFFLGSIRAVVTSLLRSRNYDVIYASWLFPDGWAAATLAKEFKVPFFQNVVGTDVNRLLLGRLITRKSLWVVDQAQRTIAVSETLKKSLVSLGAKSEKIEVVYNGVDRSIFYPRDRGEIRRQLDVPAHVRLILFVGNVKLEKGLRELAAAFASLATKSDGGDLRLVMVGSGPFVKEMRILLIAQGVGHFVSFLGGLPQHEVAMWMNACDVFCLPSYSEGQPNVVIEALACGARVVATTVGGIPELDSGNGHIRLVEPRSSRTLAIALQDQLAADTSCFSNDSICSWQENAQKVMQIFDVSMGARG